MNINQNAEPNSRFYASYMPFPKMIEVGLSHRHTEANYPLICLSKKYLNLDIEEVVNRELKNMVLHLSKDSQPKNAQLNQICQEALDRHISLKESLQKSIATHRESDWYFRYADDKYAELIMDLFLSDDTRRHDFACKIRRWAEEGVFKKIMANFETLKATRKTPEIELIKKTVMLIVQEIASPKKNSKTNCKRYLQDLNNLHILDEPRISKYLSLHGTLSKINNALMCFVKRKQYEEINQYDGLLEHFTPASIRGLANLTRAQVVNLALKGDYSAAHDLFNSEVSSGARKSLYARGHTGPSNRSTSLSTKIATYFGTEMGFKKKKIDNLWLTIYEAKKGLMMSEIEPEGLWREAEIVTPYLKPNRFLAALNFIVDDTYPETDVIRLVAADGFVAEKVKKESYKKEGCIDNIESFLNLAKQFDRLSDNEKINLHNKFKTTSKAGETFFNTYPVFMGPQPMNKEEYDAYIIECVIPYKKFISHYENSYLAELLSKPLPKGHFAYKLARLPQRFEAKVETLVDKRIRMNREVEKIRRLTLKYACEKDIRFIEHAPSFCSLGHAPSIAGLDLAATQHAINYFVKNYYSKKFPPVEERMIKSAAFYSSQVGGDYTAYEAAVESTGVARYLHGSMHASRAAFWVLTLAGMCKQNQLELTDKEIMNALLCAAAHDAGREDEGKDFWDEHSAQALLKYLDRHTTLTREKKEQLFTAIAKKDDISHASCVEHSLLHDADVLEILRTGPYRGRKKKFEISQLLIFSKLQNKLAKEMQVYFIREVREFIKLTDTWPCKKIIEGENQPLKYLLDILFNNKTKFPMIFSLLTNLSL